MIDGSKKGYSLHKQSVQPTRYSNIPKYLLNYLKVLSLELMRQLDYKPHVLGYKPCLDFSIAYRRNSKKIVRERRKYLMMVVSGGLKHQKVQTVDAVEVARILGAALVVPYCKSISFGVTRGIFDLEQFKSVRNVKS